MAEERAHDRVRAFVVAYNAETTPEVGNPTVVLRTLTPTEGIDLTLGDLMALVIQAEALYAAAPGAAHAIEVGPTKVALEPPVG